MALLIQMKSGCRHFAKGEKAPTLLNLYFDSWWNPFCWSGWWFPADFLEGPRLQLRISEIESIVFANSAGVEQMIRQAQAQASRLARA